jgi:cell division protein ZapA
MSTVTLTIGPKSYPISCADGQESQIEALGALIAEKYALIGSARAPLEAHNMLFAALFMADELAEARKVQAANSPAGIEALQAKLAAFEAANATAQAEITTLKAQLAAANAAQSAGDLFGGGAPETLSDAVIERLEALATRTETEADALEAAIKSA